MEFSDEELVLLYLLETGSFDLANKELVPGTLTKEAVSIKCGIQMKALDELLAQYPDLFKVKNSNIKGRKVRSDCIFLSSKGVLRAKEVLPQLKESRVEYIDEADNKTNLKVSEVKASLKEFSIEMSFLDIYLRAKKQGEINLLEFIQPENWKSDLFMDHAFPEMVFISNTSCIPFGGIFTIFGEMGVVIPINKHVEVGLHPYGKGDVIRWMKRTGGKIQDAFYIEGKKGFEMLVSGHSEIMEQFSQYKDAGIFENEEEYKGYFEALKHYDYSIIFSGGTAHGISMAGHIGTVLAAVAMKVKDGIEFPLNGMDGKPKHPKLRDAQKVPVWDFPSVPDGWTIKELISQRHTVKEEQEKMMTRMKKFITLSQVFERHWNSSFKKMDADKVKSFQKLFGLKEYSSGGACITSIFASPALIHLDDTGRVSFDSIIYPEISPNRNIGLLIDRKGGIDNPRNEFMDTFGRFAPLISHHTKESAAFFARLRATSGELARLASDVMLKTHTFANPDSAEERKAISDLLVLQKGLYCSLGIGSISLEELEKLLRETSLDIGIGPIGVGNSGTFFLSVPDIDSVHSLSNLIEKVNKGRPDSERMELVFHGSSHSYIFNVDPLVVIKK